MLLGAKFPASETIALREADVDLDAGTLRITKSRDEGEESEPKTRKSRRTIHLYPNLLVVLQEVRPAQQAESKGWIS